MDLLLQRGDEGRVGLVCHDCQFVDVVNDDGVVDALPLLVDCQSQTSTDLLSAGDRVVALLEHSHDEDVGVVPAFAKRGVGEDEPYWFLERQQSFLVFEDQVVSRNIGGLPSVFAALRGRRIDLLALLVDREVALMDGTDFVALQVLPVRGGSFVES